MVRGADSLDKHTRHPWIAFSMHTSHHPPHLVDQPGRMNGFILWHFLEAKQVKTNLSILPGESTSLEHQLRDA